VLLFFAGGLHGVRVIGKRWPEVLLGAALVLYTTQIAALLVLLLIFRDASYLNGRAFGFAMLACALVWPAAQAWMQTRVKTLYVQTEAPADTPADAPADTPAAVAEGGRAA
jgi:ATP synthase protein I